MIALVSNIAAFVAGSCFGFLVAAICRSAKEN